MTASFTTNWQHIDACWRTYRALLWLSKQGAVVVRHQVTAGRCLIEITDAVPGIEPFMREPDPKNHHWVYRSNIRDFQVIWRKPLRHDEPNPVETNEVNHD